MVFTKHGWVGRSTRDVVNKNEQVQLLIDSLEYLRRVHSAICEVDETEINFEFSCFIRSWNLTSIILL
jgi:hypothetical protein